MEILKDGKEELLNLQSHKHKVSLIFPPPSPLTVFLFCTHTSCFAVGPVELLLTNERPSRPSIRLSGVFVCVQYHYSVPGQIINVCCCSCSGHQSSGLTRIPREIILVFTKQKRVNKEGRETKQKQDESCQESAEEQIREYLVPTGKEILRHIYIYIYVSTVCFIEYDFYISLCSFSLSSFLL